ncbi:MAG: hypothetical protein F4114_09000 [Rhodospirillaceae bacterium]|nr:hypothetical protein [Rhodospirillaceae bacterium]MYB12480.1 hypothetical protein [Rhodospirillaceae bacterium]MYI49211.1 hypothetical protein [Rhodospirillaceae bacterium]
MIGSKLCRAAVCAGFLALGTGAANADYSKGQSAWDAGRHGEAVKQWRAAAQARDGRAMLALGRAFAKGLGVPQDYVEAHKWLNLAAGTGSAKAAAERDALAGKMTADERAEARKLARAWWLNREKAVRKAAAESGTPAAPAAKSDPKITGSGDKPKAGGDDAAAKPEEPVSPSDIREAQKLLAVLGYAPGPADGQWGPRSGRAYGAFLRDAGLPTAKGLTAPGLIELRAAAKRRKGVAEKRRKETGKKKEAAAAPREPDEDRSVGVQSGQTAGQAIAKVVRLAIQMAHAAILVRMANNPEKFGDVTPELRALLSKMVSGLSESDLSDTGDATVSLAALSPTERGRMSELLKRDKALPAKTRTALSNSLKNAAASRAAPGPSCAGMREGAKCWKKIANKPGCRLWDDYLYLDQTVTWSGSCSNGIAVGPGKTVWTKDGRSHEGKGSLVLGKRHGRWAVRFSDGTFGEGSYVDDKAQGRWVWRYTNGTVSEGPYRDGKRHGRWIDRYRGGGRLEFEYRNGSFDRLPGVYIAKSGKRYPGRWSGYCFRDGKGRLWAWYGKKENCSSR